MMCVTQIIVRKMLGSEDMKKYTKARRQTDVLHCRMH